MTYDENNIFAKILRGEIPSHKIYENEYVLAFLDIMPVSIGHALVIPKYAACDILDIPIEHLRHVIDAVQLVAKTAQTAFAPDGISIEQRSGAAAGQEVFHLHFHVTPRYEGVPLMPHVMKSNDILAPIAEKYKTAFK
jgi:histidine triad (HIT) family protein